MFTVISKIREALVQQFGDHNKIEEVDVGSVMDLHTFKLKNSIYFRMTVDGSVLLANRKLVS